MSEFMPTVSEGLSSGVKVFHQPTACPTGLTSIPVAVYCRVSTDQEIQKSSLALQMTSYQQLIDAHPGWTLAGIYADEGISGTSLKHRLKFVQMLEDARQGKVKYILAKSISRFARNTIDTLNTVRELRNIGVGVYFEKEHIDTLQTQSEFILTMFAAAAQEDIMTLSTNLKLGYRMRFERGIPKWSAIYGYRKQEKGGTRDRKYDYEWVVVENEAEIIRRIFQMYYEGHSIPAICETLQNDKIPAPIGEGKWWKHTISAMLHNEKYVGDILMQKSYTADPITHKKASNRDATIKQYYKENHHAPIVDRQLYNKVQKVLQMNDTHRGMIQYPYYGTLKCPVCGANMVRFATPVRLRPAAWTCGGHGPEEERSKRTSCPPYVLHEDDINAGVWNCVDGINVSKLKALTLRPDGELAMGMMKIIKRRIFRKSMDVSYAFLDKYVEKIAFPSWDMIRITWKFGMTTEAEMQYPKPSRYPFHVLKKSDDGYFSNGQKITHCGRQAYEGIIRNRDYCSGLRIQDTPCISAYITEPGVPIVSGPDGDVKIKEEEDASKEDRSDS